jgi:hypothetical protein
MKKMESHHPYGSPYGGKVHSCEELNTKDHLVPSSKGKAPLPDAERETWKTDDLYPMQPTHGIPNNEG